MKDKKTVLISSSERETKRIASELASALKRKAIICLRGDLGSGKTVFAKGFANEAGVSESEIKSPTYTLMKRYPLSKGELYHFDFYRVEALDDITAHDLEEIFSKKNVFVIIEWPERIEALLPKKCIEVALKYIDAKKREITIRR